MRDRVHLTGLSDGSVLRTKALTRAEVIAMMIDSAEMSAADLGRKYGVSLMTVYTIWDRTYEAGGIRGYDITVRRRPVRSRHTPYQRVFRRAA